MAPKIDAKSMKTRGCVFGAFLERPWAPKGGTGNCFWTPFGDHFGPKIEKRHSKRHAKFDAEKVLKINAKRLPK